MPLQPAGQGARQQARASVPPPRYIDLEHAGGCHRIALKRVGKARRFTLRVRAATGEIVLTLPPNGSIRAATSFARRNADWIGERIAALSPKIPFAVGSLVPLRGVPHRIEHRASLRRAVWTEAAEDAQPSLCVGGSVSGIADTLRRFLEGEARRDLRQAIARHSERVGKPVGRLSLRDTTSRWGSCSSTGTLSFSWRLILAPPFVLDYLAAHEVAHLVHMNHSPAFWATAGSLAPQLSEAETWLKAHGPSLHQYGP